MIKKRVVVLFGGMSSEHEVSCISAITIIENINKDIFDIILIGITKEGHWIKVDNIEDIKSNNWINSKKTAIISPDCIQKSIIIFENNKTQIEKVDVIFPALHGLYGEDGTVQGLLELAKIPYVGSGVLASAICMDKLYTKIIADSIGVRQANYVGVLKEDFLDIDGIVQKVENKLKYPVFVKPSNAGSSRGVSKAKNKEELINGLKNALLYDRKILVEETIVGRELECAVLGGNEVKASGIGEIIAAADFYDYDAKYNSEASKTIISPNLPEGIENKIKETAINIFKAVDGYGLARVDFFYDTIHNEVIFNEINTLPGFTSISMYPMLWEAKGLSKGQLIEKLIELAIERFKD